VTVTATVFLGIIAVATFVMALAQLAAVIYAGRVARRAEETAARVERQLQPLLERANEMSGEAARALSLAVTQVERVDRLMADVTTRVEQTAAEMQRAVVMPLRQGTALVAGIRAGVEALLRVRRRRQASFDEDEDALFIG
jgi:hypothetical protein